MMTVIPPIEEGTFSFDEQGTITIDAGTLLPSVRYSLMMTLSHKEEIEQDPSCVECTTLQGITFEVHDLVPPEFSLAIDQESSLNYDEFNNVKLELLNP